MKKKNKCACNQTKKSPSGKRKKIVTINQNHRNICVQSAYDVFLLLYNENVQYFFSAFMIQSTRAIFFSLFDMGRYRQFGSAILINLLIDTLAKYTIKGRPFSLSLYFAACIFVLQMLVAMRQSVLAKPKVFYIDAIHWLNMSIPHRYAAVSCKRMRIHTHKKIDIARSL